jgi:hypothetical protein
MEKTRTLDPSHPSPIEDLSPNTELQAYNIVFQI